MVNNPIVEIKWNSKNQSIQKMTGKEGKKKNK